MPEKEGEEKMKVIREATIEIKGAVELDASKTKRDKESGQKARNAANKLARIA